MRNRVLSAILLAAIASGGHRTGFGQIGSAARYRVEVNMVVLTFRVTDRKGNAIQGLTPADIAITEDGIPQKIVAFSEGSRAITPNPGEEGTNIFVLFDTSNHMYGTFPYVHDAISQFVWRLDEADSVAIYTFSRNLFRAAPLTRDHALARSGLSNAIAGDDTALFNALLLTLRDAAAVRGRKSVVVFSNGADNASMVSPFDVGRVAEDEGIPVYVISSNIRENDRTSIEALNSLTERTGGRLFRTYNRKEQAAAFQTVRQEIESSYTACYYPAPNENTGFRNIKLEVQRPDGEPYVVRTRPGYQFKAATAANTP